MSVLPPKVVVAHNPELGPGDDLEAIYIDDGLVASARNIDAADIKEALVDHGVEEFPADIQFNYIIIDGFKDGTTEWPENFEDIPTGDDD